MSRKDYRVFAEAIAHRISDPTCNAYTVAIVAQDIADICKRDNANFRYDRFYAACGLTEWGEVK